MADAPTKTISTSEGTMPQGGKSTSGPSDRADVSHGSQREYGKSGQTPKRPSTSGSDGFFFPMEQPEPVDGVGPGSK